MDLTALIASQPALACLPSSLLERATRLELPGGASVFRQGDPVHALHAVLCGEVRLLRRDPQGMEIVLQRARQGFLAEASLASRAYHCDAVLTETSTLLRFPTADFQHAIDTDAAFRAGWITLLAREVRTLRAQCERLSLHSAAARVLHYLAAEGEGGQVHLTQTRKAWAAELGLSHESLYRTLKRLQQEGAIHVDGKRIVLSAHEDRRG